MTNKKQTWDWARYVCKNGTHPDKENYRATNGIGEIAERKWNDSLFTYGIEYGILIAVHKIFGEEPK